MLRALFTDPVIQEVIDEALAKIQARAVAVPELGPAAEALTAHVRGLASAESIGQALEAGLPELIALVGTRRGPVAFHPGAHGG